MGWRLVSRNTSGWLYRKCFETFRRNNFWFLEITWWLILHKFLEKFTLFHTSYFWYSCRHRGLILLILLRFLCHSQLFECSKPTLRLRRWYIIILLLWRRWLLDELWLVDINLLPHYDSRYPFLFSLNTRILKLIILYHWFSISIYHCSRSDWSFKVL